MTDQIGINLLTSALIAVQKLHKKMRQLRNQGDCSQESLESVTRALAALRVLADREAVKRVDIDSRGERRKP